MTVGSLQISRADSFTHDDEEDTSGAVVSVQVLGFVLELWLTRRKRG